MQIGTVDIPSQLVLAPMAGVTDLAFRLILPISAITSFVGAPVFIYLLFKGVNR